MLMLAYNSAMTTLRRRPNCQQTGFTLIEQLLTATILSLIVIAVVEGFVGVGLINTRANAQTQADAYLQQQLEIVRNTPYTNLTTGANDLSNGLSTFPLLQNPRSATRTVTEITAGTLKRVDITITYTLAGRSKTVSTATLVSNKGINR